MNVLSLFDGMSCGQIALDNLGIKVDDYFASEIDKYAIQVTKNNYPNTKHIGDVTQVRAEDLPKIDLLIGGSPCQSFSIAGNGKGFDGSSGLIGEYFRLIEGIKPTYFLLENVKMQKKEWESIITYRLGVEPVIINSATLTAQRRRRLYWTNIPNVTIPKDMGISFEDIIEYGNTDESLYLSDKQIEYGKAKHKGKVWSSGKRMGNMAFPNYTHKKSQCLSAVEIYGARETNHIADVDGRIRVLSTAEYERLQGLPDKYTMSVSTKQAKKMIGNGWTVPIIEHIFSGLKTI